MSDTIDTQGGRILVAEDDRFYRQILEKRLKAAGHYVVLTANGAEAWEQIQADPPEVLLTDWMMPELDGYELCTRLKRQPNYKSVYCILLTAKDSTEDKVSALDGGADDYLLKPCDDGELLARVRTGLRVHRLYKQLQEVSITDPLTGVGNRRYFDQRLSEEISRARRHGTPLSLVLFDIDRFKDVNDEHGHAAGDEVLVAVGRALLRRTRAGEVAARIGGDEFAVILPNTPEAGAEKLAQRLEELMASLRIDVPHGPRLGTAVSAGHASLGAGDDANALFRAADRRLYDRKRAVV